MSDAAVHPDEPTPDARWWLSAEKRAEAESAAAADKASAAEATRSSEESSDRLPARVFDQHAEIARSKGWAYVDLDDEAVQIDPEVIALMEPRAARQYAAIPVAADDATITLAVEDPSDLHKSQELRALFPGRTLRLVYSNPAAIQTRIGTSYSALSEYETRAKRPGRATATTRVQGGDLGRVASAEDSDTVALLELLLEQATREDASDVHIEPTENGLNVRIRVDGKLKVLERFPSDMTDGLVNVIKVRSSMRQDIRLVPDSGVMPYTIPGGKTIDIRVETTPTAWGQGCVMRLQTDIWRPLSSVGFSERNFARYTRAIGEKTGVVLLTGPTGSGKSTTLYASLREKISPEECIVTLENPIEYKAPEGIRQITMNVDQGMTFGSGLRSILRQDPDIILVGEVRDRETAETAVDAAMTGHLMFSTLHTNDAVGAVPRLIRLGIEPFLVSSSLLCVVGQRLVRRLCTSCRTPYQASATDLDDVHGALPDFDMTAGALFAPREGGCKDCEYKGYAGRVPIHEVLLMTADLRVAVAENAPEAHLLALARAGGMTSMREDGLEKALTGLTSLSEVLTTTRSF